MQLIRFSRTRTLLPPGSTIAGVPVGGLDREGAEQRLLEAYSTPVELKYKDAIIHLNPSVVDFQPDIENMLATAEMQHSQKPFWPDFWDFLWSRTGAPAAVPLISSFSEDRLRTYLDDVALRYNQPAQPAAPIPGTVSFQPGQSGISLDQDGAVLLIDNALKSLTNRQVALPLKQTAPTRPALHNLEVLLKQKLDTSGFQGVSGIYLQDLQTAEEIQFIRQNGKDLPVEPDLAFTASSMIKIPIMISAFRRLGENPDSETMKLLADMIDLSGNEAADWLMDRVIDNQRGPLLVTDDMKALGLNNTFLAGYFSLGSPLLAQFQTPANSRADANTDPDPYNQTTPSEMGMLLTDIYQCARNEGGALTAVFPNEISRSECQAMNTYLINNRLPVLLTAGLPEGTQIAHKHGWVSTNGIINTIGDAGIVYTLGGNYVLVIFLNNTDQLLWDPASTLIGELSRAVYNYYNLPLPES